MSYKVNIGLSNKHVHLSQADLEKLFGEGYELRLQNRWFSLDSLRLKRRWISLGLRRLWLESGC